jgi:hypothetical protein
MKRAILLPLLMLIGVSCFAQQLTKADYLADLQYLKDTLPKRHINLFAKISKERFNQKVDELGDHFDQPDPENFTTGLLTLMVAIGDEHTHIEPVFTKALPIKFTQFDEGIYVTATDSANSDVLLHRLSGINGVSISKVTDLFKTVIQAGNSSLFEVGLLSSINNPAILKGLKITNSMQEASLDLMAPNGKTIHRTIPTVNAKSANELHLKEVKTGLLSGDNSGNYWYQYDPKSKTLYFNYNRCAEQEGKPFNAFNDELFALINKQRPSRLVLDLRNNGGGNSAVLKPFIEKIQDSYLNSKDKLFVLIGKRTFSSALMNAVALKRGTQATLVGQPTSGSVNHYGEVRGFRLPHTKMIIGYSTRYWETWPGYDGPLRPDVEVSYSVKNFEKGIDEALLKVNGN